MKSKNLAFSLLELSIALVIIGLLSSGIVVGHDLIKSAELRGQIQQFDEFRAASKGFEQKYNAMAGDFKDAELYGLHPRQNCRGHGNGDGVVAGVENINKPCDASTGGGTSNGETLLFWQDLFRLNFISGDFRKISDSFYWPYGIPLENVMPKAAVGEGNFVTIWPGPYYAIRAMGEGTGIPNIGTFDGSHLFGIYQLPNITSANNRRPGMTVSQAKWIDEKIDDGAPQSGSVLAIMPGGGGAPGQWAAGGGLRGASQNDCCAYSGWTPPITFSSSFLRPTNAAVPYAPTNCYDNNGVAGTPQAYSMRNAEEKNCTISVIY
jgi:prepilin-type N-terminal cleavage/methylation domain-containing protein